MAGRHFSYMDAATGLWRVARCVHYTFAPTVWSEATSAQWQHLHDNFLSPIVPQVPLPAGLLTFAPVTWPPLRESWKFGPPLTGPWIYSHHSAGPRARGFTVTDVRRIKAAPLTPGQLAWNRRVLEMQRIRLTQIVALWELRNTNRALRAALSRVDTAPDRGDLVRNAEAALVQRNNHDSNQSSMPWISRDTDGDVAPATIASNPFSTGVHSVAGLDEVQLMYSIRKQVAEHTVSGATKQEIIDAWSQHYSGPIVVGFTNAAWNVWTADPAAFGRGVTAEGARRRLGGLSEAAPGTTTGVTPGPGAVVPGGALHVRPADIVAEAGAAQQLPIVHKPIVMGRLTPGQLNREIRRQIDLGTFPPGVIIQEFGRTYGRDTVTPLVRAAEAAQQSAGTYNFHQTVRAEQRPQARHAADQIEANVPAGPGRSVINPRVVLDTGNTDTSSGRPGPGAMVPGGATNVRPADIVAEAGGHHVGPHPGHRHRPGHVVPYVSDLVADYHFVPVFNPADFDKGISSHSLAASSSSAVTATTQGTVAIGTAPSSFWHTAGAVWNAGAAIATYYMGNDPCRVASGRRRMVGTAESALAVRTGETYEQWSVRNAMLIVARGATDTMLAKALYQKNEPQTAQTQSDCVQTLDAGAPVEEMTHLQPVMGPISPDTHTLEEVSLTEPECQVRTVPLSTGATKFGKSGPAVADTTTEAKDNECVDLSQDYTLWLVGLIILVALAAIIMN